MAENLTQVGIGKCHAALSVVRVLTVFIPVAVAFRSRQKLAQER